MPGTRQRPTSSTLASWLQPRLSFYISVSVCRYPCAVVIPLQTLSPGDAERGKLYQIGTEALWLASKSQHVIFPAKLLLQAFPSERCRPSKILSWLFLEVQQELTSGILNKYSQQQSNILFKNGPDMGRILIWTQNYRILEVTTPK